MTMSCRMGLLLFPKITQLDLAGPYEVFSRVPGAAVCLIWKDTQPIRSEWGLELRPDTRFGECPALDVLCVPGGPGIFDLLGDDVVVDAIRAIARRSRFVASVCTGAFLLGAAGLLAGRRATTHWASRELLREFGAIPDEGRIVIDGNLITAGGITAGIDFGLHIAAQLVGDEQAKEIQLAMEYDPAPPFASGSPRVAEPATVARFRERVRERQERRAALVREAMRRFGAGERVAGQVSSKRES
jgi:cyclohexyl-isocyanide hydratase